MDKGQSANFEPPSPEKKLELKKLHSPRRRLSKKIEFNEKVRVAKRISNFYVASPQSATEYELNSDLRS